MATAKTRQKILDCFFDLLTQHPYEDVRPAQLADAAGVRLSVLRDCFPSKVALVAAFAERVDMAVLDEQSGDMDDQPARDRLFDVLMTRIDHLAPHKEAIRTLYRSARKDPLLALEFNRIAVRSQHWMLEAARIEMRGAKTQIAAQGLAVAFARVVETWLDEPDAGMPRTMAQLDKELDRGEEWMRRVDQLAGIANGVARFASLFRGGRRNRGSAERDDWGNPMEDSDPGPDAASSPAR
ncbi:hypothetical protein GCM10011316_03960 [Roseibium aquae]|uniref:HTH tetR-type domain-containing protein n=1 Tax=Roseibium aquae TaxID=1323746 RepID=A0A916T946_9HYPH|nr:TetR/AcrR family transcriptional regulator [Roseibium aquae]GGB35044.1 hypothetical protein GCM10011316_03960 [Roseibium aquae]